MAGAQGEIETLIAMLARLPGLGPRSARRAVLHLLRKRDLQMLPLAQALLRTAQQTRNCRSCGNFCQNDLCDICLDPARANGEICVVVDVADLWALEQSGAFKGRYHVLGGTLSALDAIGPEELRVPALLDRLTQERISEVLLALPVTVDAQTTAHYLAEAMAGLPLTISSLAQGIPVGGELDYLDEGTLGAAIRARRKL